jgi:Flp pilus assembly protein TadG
VGILTWSGLAGRIRHCARQAQDDGQAIVEFALCLPILLLVVTGITAFGLTINNYLQLTDGVAIGSRLLAISRGQTLDPCAYTATAVYAAAPYLTQKNLTFKYVLNGTSYSGTSCSSASATTGAAGNLVQGGSAQITVTYPCTLLVYGANLASGGCTLTARTTELIQ